MSNRRLVPMPAKRHQRLSEMPAVQRDKPAPPTLADKVRATPVWILFAWLIATAVVYHLAGKLILFGFAIGLIIRGWIWLSERFPRTMVLVNFFSAELLRSGRRRR